MTTTLNEEERPFFLPSFTKIDDYVDLYADIPCIVAYPHAQGLERNEALSADN